jgi:predicted Co/Zn/Cd cation transporter (cation efflux family)
MEQNVFELKALRWGFIINVCLSVVGIVFYILTKSMSIFLDMIIASVLVLSSIISIYVSKHVEKKYHCKPNKFTLENAFLIFRSVLMIVIILYSLIGGISSIVSFKNGTYESEFEASNLELGLFCFLMCGGCLLIMGIFMYYYKKVNKQSGMILIEIKAAIFDTLVTFFGISSLWIFSNISFLSSVKEIGDSITVVMLSIIYIFIPLKEIFSQLKFYFSCKKNENIE